MSDDRLLKISAFGVGASGSFESLERPVEDIFAPDYTSVSTKVLESPYNLVALSNFVFDSNTLGICIDAMETNIETTGGTVIIEDGDSVSTETFDHVSSLLDEPYPGISFITLRRDLRRDLEIFGFAALEVIRAVDGNVMFLRNMRSLFLRFCRLSEAYPITVTVSRGGDPMDVKLKQRFRSYGQKVNLSDSIVYFKDFNVPYDIHRVNGTWHLPGTLPIEDRGTELLMFGVNLHNTTPYYVPRWVSQIPSILLSRKAELENIAYMDSGGVPSTLMLIQGGKLAADVKTDIESLLKSRKRVVVGEVISTGATFDKEFPVKIQVERFGQEQLKDSLFSSADSRWEERVRKSFRLPPLFLGDVGAYNYATAKASYQVAESQIFATERFEFDEIITKRLLRSIGATGLKFVSNPITLHDIDTKLAAVGLIGTHGLVTKDMYLRLLKELSGLSISDEEIAAVAGEPMNEPVLVPNISSTADGKGKNPQGRDSEKEGVSNLDDNELIERKFYEGLFGTAG